jgi:hypothetical protein
MSTRPGEEPHGGRLPKNFPAAADLMVWKTDAGLFTVFVRDPAEPGWKVFRGKPSAGESIGPTGDVLLSVEQDIAWGLRVPVKALPEIEQRFFRAYLTTFLKKPPRDEIVHCPGCRNPVEHGIGRQCPRCAHVILS